MATGGLRILMMIPYLPMGGAETFFVRLANHIARQNQVVVFMFTKDTSDEWLVRQLGVAKIAYPWFSQPLGYRILYKLSLIIGQYFPKFSLVDWIRCLALRSLQARHQFDVINPHLAAAERLACIAFAHDELPIVGSDHGDYRWVINDDAQGFYRPIFERSNGLICPSESNLKVARTFARSEHFKYFKIFYGYGTAGLPQRSNIGSAKTHPGFVFGMVSRGVPEKGWAEALEAFLLLKRDANIPIHLIFVGGSPYLDELRSNLRLADAEVIEFAGNQTNVEKFISSFDVGLLPTYFQGESLPNVIIEYLSQGKPVIATRQGGIEEMLEYGGKLAGILVGKDLQGRASVSDLAEAMRLLVEDQKTYRELSELASAAFKKFDIGACGEAYIAAFGCFHRTGGSVR